MIQPGRELHLAGEKSRREGQVCCHAPPRAGPWSKSAKDRSVRRRKKPVAVLSPPDRKPRMEKPDFADRLKAIYGDACLETTGTDLVNESRGER